jgi:hypothetical protein
MTSTKLGAWEVAEVAYTLMRARRHESKAQQACGQGWGEPRRQRRGGGDATHGGGTRHARGVASMRPTVAVHAVARTRLMMAQGRAASSRGRRAYDNGEHEADEGGPRGDAHAVDNGTRASCERMAAASTRLTGAIHAVRRGTARALGAAAAPQPASTQVS